MNEETAGKPEENPKKKYPPGKHPNTIANLKPPWTSETAPRNGGRPKGSRSLPHLIRDVLNQEHNGKKLAHALAEKIVKEALKGDNYKIKVILEYLSGKPAQRLEHTGADGEPIRSESINITGSIDELAELITRRITEDRKAGSSTGINGQPKSLDTPHANGQAETIPED